MEALLMGWAVRLAPRIHMDEYKRGRLKNTLAAAGLNMTPEEYTCLLYTSSHRISNTMRSFHGAWIWPHTGGNWRSETVSFHPAVWSQMPSMEPLMWRPACGGMVSPPRITAMQRGMAASSSTSTASLSTAALFCQCSCLDFVGYWYSYSPQSVIVFAKRGRNQ